MDNDLQLEWKHPNGSNGEIQYFQIELIPLDKPKSNTVKKQLPVTEPTYNLSYNYKINAPELLPSTKYRLKVVAYNGYFGHELTKNDVSPPDIPSLQEVPQISASNDTLTVTIKANRPRGTYSYRLTLLISDEHSTVESRPELENFHLKNFRVVSKCGIMNFDQALELTVGDQTQPPGCDQNLANSPLNLDTSYNVTIILTNTFENQSRYQVSSYILNTTAPTSKPVDLSLPALLTLLVALSMLLLGAIILFIFRKRHQTVALKDSTSSNEILEIQEIPQAPSKSQDENAHGIIETEDSSNGPEDSAKQKGYSKSIKIDRFEEYFKESVENGELERQHALLPRGQTKPWTCGCKPENKTKNRHDNLMAYDHSRVILRKLKNKPHSDYINANFIEGYRIPKAYIATQGPKTSTVSDFWRMIWQENAKYIVTLANLFENGEKQMEKYWPAINESFTFDDIIIKHVSNKVHADFEHRLFQICRKEKTRTLEQLHYNSWPDHDVPLYPERLVPFLKAILALPLTSKSPLVVHCTAGIGRTGMILLCDICLRTAAEEGSVDVLGQLRQLREQRANMVDNVGQYKLAHLVILQCLNRVDTAIPCHKINESVNKLLKTNEVKFQMRYLESIRWQDNVMKEKKEKRQKGVTVREKNRFSDVIPEIQGRVFISRYPPSDDTSTYINAVTVDGFRCPGKYIVTQQPMPNTLGDFWRLVDEKNVSVIISLNRINGNDKTSCDFWPAKGQMNPVDYITLKKSNSVSLKSYDVITIHMNAKGRKDHRVIEIFSLTNWPPMTVCPKSIKEFVPFWEDSDAESRKSNPVIVTCHDGVKASGLYVAMSFVVEKMKLEQVCDVCQAVRSVRHYRNQFVQDEDQFVFLHRAAVEYIAQFQSYANFT